ncbi:hypothetical protein PGIGA_G00234270 [Pangasianodon gigas]|uniref:Uncharacterized protein n=1 Tax=Pangasianodon gigas TaxID=30993 RepID=A0ACC5WM31_PANGG|nr:hypothetical protein [Pangasianodon gigas]
MAVIKHLGNSQLIYGLHFCFGYCITETWLCNFLLTMLIFSRLYALCVGLRIWPDWIYSCVHALKCTFFDSTTTQQACFEILAFDIVSICKYLITRTISPEQLYTYCH